MPDLNISIIQSSDDAEEHSAPAIPNLVSADLDFYGGTGSNIGLVLQNVTIPPGSTILTVVVRFTANSTRAGPLHTQAIRCQAIDDAPTFTTDSGNVSTRTKTTAFVTWIPGSIVTDQQYDTIDFAAVLQEVIDRPGWASGQDIAIIITGVEEDGNSANAWAFDHGSDEPQLRITYSEITAGYALVF